MNDTRKAENADKASCPRNQGIKVISVIASLVLLFILFDKSILLFLIALTTIITVMWKLGWIEIDRENRPVYRCQQPDDFPHRSNHESQHQTQASRWTQYNPTDASSTSFYNTSDPMSPLYDANRYNRSQDHHYSS